jgi:hypothetical protein
VKRRAATRTRAGRDRYEIWYQDAARFMGEFDTQDQVACSKG